MHHREPFTVVTHTLDILGFDIRQVWAYNPTDAMVQAQTALEAEERAVDRQTCFLGHHAECDPNEGEFDWEAHKAPPLTENDEQVSLFDQIIQGHKAGQVALMTGFFEREPVNLMVNVYQTGDDEVLIQPLYIQITDTLLRRLRADDGTPVGETEEDD